jgi:serine/threonine-protein kinase
MTLQVIGRYRILGEVGRGGMGVVYRAVQPSLNREVALKVLPASLAHDPELVARFRQEARLAANLKNPNIVVIHETGEDAGNHYIAMEFLRGRTLEEILRARKRLSVEETVSIARQILSALAYAHAQGVVHRDVKPANIVVDDNGHVTITDFGIARAADRTRMTIAGTRMGTAGYMSPEQSRGMAADARSDLYSVGVLLYEMLTGRAPFVGEDQYAVMHQHVYERPYSPRSLNPDVPGWLETVVLRALEKDPGARFQSAGDMDAVLAAQVPTKVTRPPMQQARRPAALWVLLLVVFVAVGGIAYHLLGQEGGEQMGGGGGGGGPVVGSVLPKTGVKVPAVVGAKIEEAVDQLSKAGFRAEIEERSDSKYPVGYVASQDPDADSEQASGSAVHLVKSTGEKPVEVPRVIGLAVGDAKEKLQSLTLTAIVNEPARYSDIHPAGYVMAQMPDAGTRMDHGDTVYLAQSKGPRPVETTGPPPGLTWSHVDISPMGCSVDCPANWMPRSETRPDGSVRQVFESGQPDLLFLVERSTGWAGSSAMDNWRDMSRRFAKRHGGRYREILIAPEALAGQDGARWEFRLTREDGGTVYKIDVGALSGEDGWAVLCQSPADAVDAWRPHFERIIRSFSFEKKAEPD